MGQYYAPISLDKKQFLKSWDYDSGAKLMEHSWLKNGFVGTAMSLLAVGGDWWRTRIVWAGDYMDEGLFLEGNPTFKHEGEEHAYNLYGYASDHFEKIEPESKGFAKLKYILNHDKKEFVSLIDLPDNDGWRVHPLPLLTCSGNGRGGGDYTSAKASGYSEAQRGIYSKLYHAQTDEEKAALEEEIEHYQTLIEIANGSVGRWAGDHISAEFRKADIPKDFIQIKPDFKE